MGFTTVGVERRVRYGPGPEADGRWRFAAGCVVVEPEEWGGETRIRCLTVPGTGRALHWQVMDEGGRDTAVSAVTTGPSCALISHRCGGL